jgi:hypothetical protein
MYNAFLYLYEGDVGQPRDLGVWGSPTHWRMYVLLPLGLNIRMPITNPSVAAAQKTPSLAAAPPPLSTAAGALEAHSAAAAHVMLSTDEVTEAAAGAAPAPLSAAAGAPEALSAAAALLMLSTDEGSEAAPGKREAFSAAAAPAILAGCTNERLRRKRTQPWTSHLPIAAVDGAVDQMNLTAVDAGVEFAAGTQPITPAASTQPITPSSLPQDSQYERDEQSPLSGQTLFMFRSANSP